MTANGNGTRATARIPGISTNTVTAILKEQESQIWQVNYRYIQKHLGVNLEIDIISSEQIEVNEVEMDEMWSFVHDKSQQYWLWWAIDHHTGEPLAFCLGTREHKYLDELLRLLAPFNIHIVYSDANYAYQAHITKSDAVTGKRNTQRTERKHLSLRTWCSRLVRKGIRFSKTHQMHSIIVGLIINIRFLVELSQNFLFNSNRYFDTPPAMNHHSVTDINVDVRNGAGRIVRAGEENQVAGFCIRFIDNRATVYRFRSLWYAQWT